MPQEEIIVKLRMILQRLEQIERRLDILEGKRELVREQGWTGNDIECKK